MSEKVYTIRPLEWHDFKQFSQADGCGGRYDVDNAGGAWIASLQGRKIADDAIVGTREQAKEYCQKHHTARIGQHLQEATR